MVDQDDDELLALPATELEKRLAKVEAGIRKSEKATRFARFEPVPFQRERGWFDSDHFKVLAWICGNRVGKSEAAVIRVISACMGVRPESLGGVLPRRWSDLRGTQEGRRYLAMCPTLRQSAKHNLLAKLRTYVTDDMLTGKPRLDENGVPYEWNFVTGAQLSLQSYKSPLDAVEGMAWDGIWFDEPPPRDIWVGATRGTADREGFILLTATPVGENAGWFDAELIQPSINPECRECGDGTGELSHAEAVAQQPMHGWVKRFEAELHDNCRECNSGHIPHAEIEFLRSQWTQAERLIREYGDLTASQNFEFPYVNEKTHVVADMNPVEFGLPIVEIVDPAPRRGLFMKWYTVTQSNLWYCFDAVNIPAKRGFGGMAEAIKLRRKQIGFVEPDLALLDPRGGKNPTVTVDAQSDWFQEFKKQGLIYKPAIGMGRKQGDTGELSSIEVLHDWLKLQFNPATEEQEVAKLRFCRRVTHIEEGPLWAYRRFSWDHSPTNKRKYMQPGKDWIDLDAYLVLWVNHHKLTYAKFARREPQVQRRSLAETYASAPRPMHRLLGPFSQGQPRTQGAAPWTKMRGENWRRVS